MKKSFIFSVIFFLTFLEARSGFTAEVMCAAYEFARGRMRLTGLEELAPRSGLGLVLSGGGARGMVHIGVLKALEENHIPIDMIVGTSIGSIIGGLYAMGYTPDEIIEITKSIQWSDIYRDETQRTSLFLGQKGEQDRYLLNLRFKNGNPYIPVAISPGQKIFNILSDLVLRARFQARNNFDNLYVPFRAVATDLVSGQMVVLRSGNLATALNASSAIPLLFVPVAVDSMLLVDGGMRSNLPVQAALNEGIKTVLAVDVSSPLRGRDRINAPWEIVDQATTIMADLEIQEERKKADILIHPQLPEITNDDYSRIDELVDIGYRETLQKIPLIKKKLRSVSENNPPLPVNNICFSEDTLDFDIRYQAERIKELGLGTGELRNLAQSVMNCGFYRKMIMAIDSTDHGVDLKVDLVAFDRLDTVLFIGVTRYEPTYLQNFLLSVFGKPLNARVLNQDLDRIVGIYRQDGYSLMKIDSLYFKDHVLKIFINEGEIGRIRIVGNQRVRDYVIAREFNPLRGKVFNWRQVRNAVRNTHATQLFDRVYVDVEGRGAVYDLRITVQEKSTKVLKLGGKYDTERKGQIYLELGDESLYGTGIKGMLVGRLGTKDRKLGIKIRDDRIFTTYFTFDLQGFYHHVVNPIIAEDGRMGEYMEIRRGATFQVGQQLKRLGQLIFEIRHENITEKLLKEPFAYVDDEIILRTFAVRASADKRDRAYFPRRGIHNYWAWEAGNQQVLGGKESYTKALVNLEGYYSFRNPVTWHLRSFFGIGDRSMPFSEGFRIGGLNDFYGLHENALWGRQVFIASAEYRYRISAHLDIRSMFMRDIFVAFRYDFGGIWKEPNLVFSSSDFFSGIGGYLGIDTLFGPLYIAYGKKSGQQGIIYISWGLNY